MASSKQSQANKQIKQMQENVQHGEKKERGQQYMQACCYSVLFLCTIVHGRNRSASALDWDNGGSQRWQVNMAEAGCDLFNCRGEGAQLANWHGETEAPPTTHLWHLVGGGQTVRGRIHSPKKKQRMLSSPFMTKGESECFYIYILKKEAMNII